ncbi:N-acylneuraminate cytidylyltransferase [subsurface metagenome]
MYKGKNILGLIPARGDSKGLPRKNIKPLLGKPLIAWTIEQALASKYLDRVVVSTDDKEIAEISIKYGAEVIRRPKKLATDSSLVKDAIKYTVNKIEEDGYNIEIIVLLEPTSPLRRIEDIKKCIKILLEKDADSVATFSETDIPPNRIWKILDTKIEPYLKNVNPWLSRQKQPKAFRLNGQIYAFRKNVLFNKNDSGSLLLGKILPLITPKERAIDINTEIDFLLIEILLERLK